MNEKPVLKPKNQSQYSTSVNNAAHHNAAHRYMHTHFQATAAIERRAEDVIANHTLSSHCGD
jgi:hypothetical protein